MSKELEKAKSVLNDQTIRDPWPLIKKLSQEAPAEEEAQFSCLMEAAFVRSSITTTPKE